MTPGHRIRICLSQHRGRRRPVKGPCTQQACRAPRGSPDTWIVERAFTSRFSGSFEGESFDETETADERLNVSPKHGLTVRVVTTTRTNDPDGIRDRETRQLLSLKPS